MKLLSAKLLISQLKDRTPYSDIREAEFQVFSQFGEDGIIQYLIHLVRPAHEIFVEIGVENYTEANTRFLLINDRWQGIVIDGNTSHIEHITNDEIYWKHDLTATQAWVDRDNVNTLLVRRDSPANIGLLSIDIDGNDYWIWESITCVMPDIVIVEYNSVFGCEYAVSVPYDMRFERTRAHYSNLYWGCSLKALEILGAKKGYSLVGSNSAGNNAFFVRNEKLGVLQPLSTQQAYVASTFRESRARDGTLTYLTGSSRRQQIEHMLVVDIETNSLRRVGEL